MHARLANTVPDVELGLPNTYAMHGLLFASEFALPELEPRRVPSARPDVIFRLRTIEPSPAESDSPASLDEFAGGLRLNLRGIGRFLLRRGKEVLVDAPPSTDGSLMRLYLLGLVIGLVFHQRGLLALHASAVAAGGQAVAFTGVQGAGKSTVAAHCAERPGVRVVADDTMAVTFDRRGRPCAHPGMPSLKLWRDALEILEQDPTSLRPDWFRADKFHLPIADRSVDMPVPLRRVYVLDEHAEPDPRIEPITGTAAVAALIVNTYGIRYLRDEAQRASHFKAVARLAGAVEVRRLLRRRDLGEVGRSADLVLSEIECQPGAVPWS
jgi:hypothetical protein